MSKKQKQQNQLPHNKRSHNQGMVLIDTHAKRIKTPSTLPHKNGRSSKGKTHLKKQEKRCGKMGKKNINEHQKKHNQQ